MNKEIVKIVIDFDSWFDESSFMLISYADELGKLKGLSRTERYIIIDSLSKSKSFYRLINHFLYHFDDYAIIKYRNQIYKPK